MKLSVPILFFVGLLLLCSFAEGLGIYKCSGCGKVSWKCAILALSEGQVGIEKYLTVIWLNDFYAQTSLFT